MTSGRSRRTSRTPSTASSTTAARAASSSTSARPSRLEIEQPTAAQPADKKARRSRAGKPVAAAGRRPRRPLHRHGRRSRRAHRPQVLRRDRRDRDRRGARARSRRRCRTRCSSHCETRKDRFAILDSPETITGGVDKLPRRATPSTARTTSRGSRSTIRSSGNIFVPPSGHIAGVYARVDNERGVHKAPANEIVRGALGLRYNVSKGEQDILNPKGINCIRMMQGGGIRIWGARTLSSRSVVALHQRSPPVHHGRDVDRARHPVGRVRAQRPSPVEARATAPSRCVPHARVAQRRAHGRRRRRRPSTSSATRRPIRPRSSTSAS